jgi:hypothetical protein
MEFYTGTVLANFGYGLHQKTKWLAFKKPVSDLGGESWKRNFHTWTMEWDEKKMDLLLDGELMNRLDLASADAADRGNPFHRPIYLILNQAIGCGFISAGIRTRDLQTYRVLWLKRAAF